MGLLSTEAVIFSFEGGLSTDLNGSYSQGLIHRKPQRWTAAASTGKPPSRAIVSKTEERNRVCVGLERLRGQTRF